MLWHHNVYSCKLLDLSLFSDAEKNRPGCSPLFIVQMLTGLEERLLAQSPCPCSHCPCLG